MRLFPFAALAFAVPAFFGAPVSAYEKPYDPYPWCAVYSGDAGGASNCGFSTIEQCRATVSGIGGSCEPNQFYNPGRPAVHHGKRKHVD